MVARSRVKLRERERFREGGPEAGVSGVGYAGNGWYATKLIDVAIE